MLIDIKLKERAAGGVLDADTKVVSTITSHKPGYLDKDLEKIVGLQTDKPMKKALMPYGGIRMAKVALAAYGMEIDPKQNGSSPTCIRHTTKAFLMHTMTKLSVHATTRS